MVFSAAKGKEMDKKLRLTLLLNTNYVIRSNNLLAPFHLKYILFNLSFKSFQFSINCGITYVFRTLILEKLNCFNTECARAYIYVDFLFYTPEELFYMLWATFAEIKNIQQ